MVRGVELKKLKSKDNLYGRTSHFVGFSHVLKNISLDAVFLPLDPRQQKRYADGILYFLQNVKVKQVYPMHFWGHYSIIDKFLAEYPQYE